MIKAKTLFQKVGLVVIGLCSVASVRGSIVKCTVESGGSEAFNVTIDGAAVTGIAAGGICISQGATANNASVPANYLTVSTDVENGLYIGNCYKYNTPANGFTGLSGLDPTWGEVNTPAHLGSTGTDAANAGQAIQNAAYIFYTYGNLQANQCGIEGSPAQLAGLQLAVWTALYDTTTAGTVDKSSGARFQITGGDPAAIAIANCYIAAINASSHAGDFGYDGYVLSPNNAPNSQSNSDTAPELFIQGASVEASVSVVPEPSTIIAGIMLLVPFGISSLRIFRRNCKIA